MNNIEDLYKEWLDELVNTHGMPQYSLMLERGDPVAYQLCLRDFAEKCRDMTNGEFIDPEDEIMSPF